MRKTWWSLFEAAKRCRECGLGDLEYDRTRTLVGAGFVTDLLCHSVFTRNGCCPRCGCQKIERGSAQVEYVQGGIWPFRYTHRTGKIRFKDEPNEGECARQ